MFSFLCWNLLKENHTTFLLAASGRFVMFSFPVLESAEGKSFHIILLSRFLVLSYCVETCSREIMPHFLHQLLVVCVCLVPVLESAKGISYHINLLAASGYFPMLSYCIVTC